MTVLFWIWGIINFISIFYFVAWALRSEHWYDILLYPMLNDLIEQKGYTAFSRWVIKIAFTIIFLPYLVVHFVSLLILSILVTIIVATLDMIDKMKRK